MHCDTTKGYLVGFNCSITVKVNTKEIHSLIKNLQEENQTIISFGDVILHAICQNIKKFPEFNSFFEGDITFHQHVNLSYSINLGQGPQKMVVVDADNKSLVELSSEIKHLALKYIHGELSNQEDGTFSVINLSQFNSYVIITPIFSKQSALISIASEQESFNLSNGNIIPVKEFNLSLSYDVRVADCQKALQFLNAIKSSLESKKIKLS